MIFSNCNLEKFWKKGVCGFFTKTGSDPHMGRNIYNLVKTIGKESIKNVQISYITVDTTNTSRDTICQILTYWRDGYSKIISSNSGLTYEEVIQSFDSEIENAANTADGFFCWQSIVASIFL